MSIQSLEQITPGQLAAHMRHKDRLARIASRSIELRPPPSPPPPPPPPAPKLVALADIAEPLPLPKYPPVERIVMACAKHFGVSKLDIKSARRTANVVRPRQVAMYLAKMLTLRSLPEIGYRFGGRDHTTVLHAVRKIEALVRRDWTVAHDVALIEAEMDET